MYGTFVPDMYTRNFIHYDKWGGSDPILEKPITTTGYSDLVNPGGYELIQPQQQHTPISLRKEKFDYSMLYGLKYALLIFSTIAFAFFLKLALERYITSMSRNTIILMLSLFLFLTVVLALML